MYMYQMEETNDGFEDEVMAYHHITRLFPSGWLGLWYHVVVPSTQKLVHISAYLGPV